MKQKHISELLASQNSFDGNTNIIVLPFEPERDVGGECVLEVETSFPLSFIEIISAITSKSLFVLDVTANCFRAIASNNFFLCGCSDDDTMLSGSHFFKKIIYPDDLELPKTMYRVVLEYLRHCKKEEQRQVCFSITFRLQRYYSFLNKPFPQMVILRMKPIWQNDKLSCFICSVGNSNAQNAGNLFIHGKDGLIHTEYNFDKQSWKKVVIKPLTEREKAILVLACQGRNSKEIANCLCRGHHTIRNQIKSLFDKLGVNSMQEAIDFSDNYCMLYLPRNHDLNHRQSSSGVSQKRKRILITEEILQHVRQHLESGKSIRQAALSEKISESAIRYWIKLGKLKI